MANRREHTAPAKSAEPSIPLGPRVLAVLRLAYRARRPVLLEGATGIGKSEIVQEAARTLNIECKVLDLSLLEPPDLVGLPRIIDGRTVYAMPSALPSSGAGLLMLEELNRAERYIQQPALQLLTARMLHEYKLPDDYCCVAAINPDSGDYQVSQLDPALRARFVHIRVHPDRGAWLVWAGEHNVHPSVLAIVQTQERAFLEAPPRSWSFASEILRALQPSDIRDPYVIRDALGGILPSGFVELLVSQGEKLLGKAIELDVRTMLSSYVSDGRAKSVVAGYRERGETDRLDEITFRLMGVLSGPEVGVLAAKNAVQLTSLEALLADLPGDHRERLQEALAANPTAIALLDVTVREVLQAYTGSRAEKKLAEWKADPHKGHRIGLLVTALRLHLSDPTKVIELRKSNPARAALGHLLAQLGTGTTQRWVMPLAETMQKVGVVPIRPA